MVFEPERTNEIVQTIAHINLNPMMSKMRNIAQKTGVTYRDVQKTEVSMVAFLSIKLYLKYTFMCRFEDPNFSSIFFNFAPPS
jgi:hypothetical protein